ncbi:MAG: oxidoreductase, partial [Streptosporangiales bacterium]|nr:oxidoreductase [Streptosporangiales bacterium]
MTADAPGADPFAGIMAQPGVSDAVAEAREVVDRLAGHRALRRHAPAVTAESALRGARASAALAGVDVTLSELREGPPGTGVVQGALRVTGETGALLNAWRQAPMQALARLHSLAAADLVPAQERGRPASPIAAARMQALAAALGAQTAAPAVAVAALVHGEV